MEKQQSGLKKARAQIGRVARLALIGTCIAYTSLKLGEYRAKQHYESNHREDQVMLKISNNSLASGFYGGDVNKGYPSASLRVSVGGKELRIDGLSTLIREFDPKTLFNAAKTNRVITPENAASKLDRVLLLSSGRGYTLGTNGEAVYNPPTTDFRTMRVEEGIDGGELGTWHWTEIEFKPIKE